MLTGTLPPDICQLTYLSYFDVRGNSLTVRNYTGNCTSFELLDISCNQISRDIPYNIGFLQVATLNNANNHLEGLFRIILAPVLH
ncbi:hypothetical protein HN51_001772 [Arachis hypogaea]